MSAPGKRVAVIVATSAVARTREALRAAVGLSLRGDAIQVVLCEPGGDDDPDVRRALATLRMLGHGVERGAERAGPIAREADATEVWT